MGRKNKEVEKKDDSVREKVRQKKRRKTVFSVFLVLIILTALGGLGYVLYENFRDVLFQGRETSEDVKKNSEMEVEIINENDNEEGVPAKTMEYIELLKGDLEDLGFHLMRVVLPEGKMREIYVDVEGVLPYFKVNMDRGSAVTAEDISRMIKYLKERNLLEGVSYIDVRVEGKAFYK